MGPLVYPTYQHPGTHCPNNKVQNLPWALGAQPTSLTGQTLLSCHQDSSPYLTCFPPPRHSAQLSPHAGGPGSLSHLFPQTSKDSSLHLIPTAGHCVQHRIFLSIPGCLSPSHPPFHVTPCCPLSCLCAAMDMGRRTRQQVKGAGLNPEGFSESEPPLSTPRPEGRRLRQQRAGGRIRGGDGGGAGTRGGGRA